MKKSFYFMAGLPRSGTTLIASILNQNPNIHVSALSPLINIMGLAYNAYQDSSVKDVGIEKDIYNVVDGIPDSLYKDYEANYIIDKQFHWTDDVPFSIIREHFGQNVKILCPVRNILEILSSFNTLAEKDKTNAADAKVLSFDKTKLPMPDRRANFWMNNPMGEIIPSIEGMKKARHPELRDNFHFIEYNDLVNHTQSTIEGIYKYLEIEPFAHDYNDLKTPFEFKDLFGLKDHHKIRSRISNEGKDPASVFLPNTIKKYSGLEFWRDL
jgi:sulfotransferase